MSESTTEKSTAIQKPDIAKPGMILSARRMRSALITSEKSPSVSTLIGSVSTNTIGLMNILKIAKTIASTSAPTSVTSTPGIKYAAITIASADMIQCVIFMVLLVYH